MHLADGSRLRYRLRRRLRNLRRLALDAFAQLARLGIEQAECDGVLFRDRISWLIEDLVRADHQRLGVRPEDLLCGSEHGYTSVLARERCCQIERRADERRILSDASLVQRSADRAGDRSHAI